MPRIFISYRRKDSEAITGRIYDRLVTAFGEDNVFQDVEKIPPGVDFRTYLRDQVAACDVVLVIIGQKWVSIEDEQGRRRLANPADFVRIEVENALSQSKHVIPVLVDGAGMPYDSDVPPSMQDLCFRNAATIRHNPDFNRDASKLIDGIKWWISETFERHRVPDLLQILPPPFEWCEIQAGKVSLIPDESNKKSSYLKTATAFDVERFWMAKYPITNAQFEVFVTAKDGYENPKWWDYSEAAQIWRNENPLPSKTAFLGLNYPRTNVNWYTTFAFCQWLSFCTGLSRRIPIDRSIRLPTAQEWQRATQGDDERKYPWGNDFNEIYCNTAESEIGKVTLVSRYHQGISQFGVMDLAGNIWEWCLNYYSINNIKSGSRVQKGGSFNYDQRYAKISYTGSGKPTDSNYDLGFRIVLAGMPQYS